MRRPQVAAASATVAEPTEISLVATTTSNQTTGSQMLWFQSYGTTVATEAEAGQREVAAPL